jgi:hypothetical protein
MNIGRVIIEMDGSAYFDGDLIGKASRVAISQDLDGRHGSISIFPMDRSVDFMAIARDMALYNLQTTFDFDGEFWPNSYVKEGKWLAEMPGKDGIIVVSDLGVAASGEQEPDEHSGDYTLLGTY